MKRKIVELVELAYRFELDESTWLEELARRSADLTPSGVGAMIYTFDASRSKDGVEINTHSSVGLPAEFVNSMIELNRRTSDRDAEVLFRSGVVTGTVSEMLERMSARAPDVYAATTEQREYPDVWGITASAPDHCGVVVNAPLSRVQSLSTHQRLRWRQFGVHLQTAFRLRRHVDSLWDQQQAVLEADGRVVDASAPTHDADVRERLVRQAKAIECARTGASDDVGEGLDTWTGLVNGKWSLIETFDTDGRRFYLAIPNDIETRDLLALTKRERQIAAHVAQGDSNKWVAYQTGVGASTVAKLLASALKKLGLASRRELIFVYHRLGAEPDDGSSA